MGFFTFYNDSNNNMSRDVFETLIKGVCRDSHDRYYNYVQEFFLPNPEDCAELCNSFSSSAVECCCSTSVSAFARSLSMHRSAVVDLSNTSFRTIFPSFSPYLYASVACTIVVANSLLSLADRGCCSASLPAFVANSLYCLPIAATSLIDLDNAAFLAARSFVGVDFVARVHLLGKLGFVTMCGLLGSLGQ